MKRIFKVLTSSFICLCGVLTLVSCKQHSHEVKEDGWVRDANSHWHACEGCDELFNYDLHAYGDYTKDAKECKQSRTCTVCGYVQTTTVAHTFGAWATREDGTFGKECSHCHHVEYLTQYYVRGSFDASWSALDDYKLVIDAATMSAKLTVTLEKGTKFKVADAGWSKEFNATTIIAEEGLFGGTGDIEVLTTGEYTFVVTGLDGEHKCTATFKAVVDEPTADAPTTGGDEPTVNPPVTGGEETQDPVTPPTGDEETQEPSYPTPDADAVALEFTSDGLYTINNVTEYKVSEITYTAVTNNTYKCANAKIGSVIGTNNTISVKVTNNGTEEVSFRFEIGYVGDNGLVSTVIQATGASLAEYNGSHYAEGKVAAGQSVDVILVVDTTIDITDMNLFLDTLWAEKDDVHAGSVTVSNVKFSYTEVEDDPVPPAEVSVSINGTDKSFEGNVDLYNVTYKNNKVIIGYSDMIGNSYRNINTQIADIAGNSNTFTVVITNNGTATAKVRIDINSDTQVESTKAANVSGTQDGVEVWTDTVNGGSVFSIAAGQSATCVVKFDPARGTKELMFYVDSATWEDTNVYSGEVVLSNMALSETYKLSYNANEIAENPAGSLYAESLPAELPQLTVDGYEFQGWYYDAEFTDEAVAGENLTADTVLYAKWLEVKSPIEMNGVAYETIAAALAAIPTTNDTNTYTITLQKGTYEEIGLVYDGTATIHIIGDTDTKYGADVIIKGRGKNMASMRGRELLEIKGAASIILENVSLVSDYARTDTIKDAQAEVLGTDTKGNTVAYNCSFISHQDTLRTTGKAWFYGCYIEGDTDFIWMEASGSVALYENCEIVSVYDEYANTHASYIAAPRMEVSSKVGKGVVFLNSVVKESEEAKANGQLTYLARTPWSSGYYNQVAYINTICNDVEVEATSKAQDAPWYGNMITTEYPRTVIGWKMDSKTAASLNLSGKDYILDDAVTNKEFNGRKAILNRIYNTGKQRYEKDTTNNWDIDALIAKYGFVVAADTSSDILEGETALEPVVYKFDGTGQVSSMCNGFVQDGAKSHYVGNAGSTITIPVEGKSYVEVYGYYSGTVEIKADTQGYLVGFFDNGSTNKEIGYDYIVYDENAQAVVITAKAKTYITKIIVTPDANIPNATLVSSIEIERSTEVETVGVAVTLTANVNSDATNKTVVWSSSDTSIAEIDQYSGRVSFKSAGTVVLTATACDGSGVSKSIECNPIEADWTVAEWYTTDNDLAAEAGATGIGNFSAGSSDKKDLSVEYKITNVAGETIPTQKGLKLNGSGQLSIATTKPALLTVVLCLSGKEFKAPVVTNGTITVEPISSVENVESDTNKTYTYVYELTEAATWIIKRQGTSETNPILYAKCEYIKEVKYAESYSYVFADVAGNYGADAEIESNEYVEFVGCQKHDGTYIALKNNNSISINVAAGATLIVHMPYSNGITLNGADYALVADKLTYTATENETVVITGLSGKAYIQSITVKPAPKYAENYSYVFAEVEGDYEENASINSNEYIVFVGCIKKDGTYIALKENNSISINVAAGATLTVHMPYSNGVTLNGENYTLVDDYLTYTAESNETVVITGTAGQAYIQSITVKAGPKYAENYSYVFTDVAGNYVAGAAIDSTDYVKFTNCVEHNGQYIALKDNNSVEINVAAGATLTVSMPHTNGVTLNGETYTLVDNKLTYTATENETVVITGTAGQAYITSIVVTKA